MDINSIVFSYWLFPPVFLLAAKINETDTFGPGDDDEIQFDDIGDDDEDIDDVSSFHFIIHFSYLTFSPKPCFSKESKVLKH